MPAGGKRIDRLPSTPLSGKRKKETNFQLSVTTNEIRKVERAPEGRDRLRSFGRLQKRPDPVEKMSEFRNALRGAASHADLRAAIAKFTRESAKRRGFDRSVQIVRNERRSGA